MESPQARFLENHLKLLGIVALAYSFFLHILLESDQVLVKAVLHPKYYRTGTRQKEVIVPLYRPAKAISRLWEHFYPLLSFFFLFPPNLETVRALTVFRH